MAVTIPRTEIDVFADFCGMLVLESHEKMELEAFQQNFLADYFAGTIETVVLLPKKNGKTSAIAALALYHLLSTEDAECVVGASSRDQAAILFNQAHGLIRRSPDVQEFFDVKTGFREIRSTSDAGRIRVLAADAATADGVIPTLAIVDELHRHRSGALYGVFRDGLGPRNGRLITISTAGSDFTSPLGVLREKARKLRVQERRGRAYRYSATEDHSFVMHEWSLSPRDDTDDLELVKAANPASWQTLERLRARHDSPTTETWQWLRFACGIWVKGFEAWIPRYRFEERSYDAASAGRTAADENGLIPPRSEVVLAFDGSYNMDATGIMACTLASLEYREAINVATEEEYAAAASDPDLAAEIALRRAEALSAPDAPAPPHIQKVKLWERPEDAPEDWTVPITEVEDAIRSACRHWRVREIAADANRWSRSLEILLNERLPVVEFPQSPARMVPATTRLYTAVMTTRGVTHDGSEDLIRHVENAAVKINRQGAQLEKPPAESTPGVMARRIDLAVCAIMAFDRAHHYKPRRSRVVDLRDLLDEDDIEDIDTDDDTGGT